VVFFLDSSALVKRYVVETGSAWARGVADATAGNRIYVTSITGVEIVSALARRGRGGSILASDAASAIAAFRADLTRDYDQIQVTSIVLARAMNLAETRYLRGYDAVQLAAAVEVNAQRLAAGLPALIFVSADAALNAAATAEGLSVDDPNAHP